MTSPVQSSGVQARILDIAGYLPQQILTNDELAALYPEWSADKILAKTGIRERHIAAAGQTAADLAYEAARNLFAQNAVSAEDVDFVILCTQAPDYVLPTSACLLQDRLGIATRAGALDINLGCSGYVYGLSLAKGLVETGAARCVLLLTADTYSKYIHPLDRSVRTLFGDGASATAIVGSTDGSGSIGPFVFGTDGRGADNLIVKAGLFREPKSVASAIKKEDASGNVRTDEHLYMNGAEVMAFSLAEVPKAATSLLEKAGMDREDIDFFVLHQANRFMLEALRKKMKIPESRFPIVMEQCGNTVSSTVPLALKQMKDDGMLRHGSRLMLLGFGVGYSWAGCLVNY
ncbi:ketoacyl-ACP synthase III [Paraburkholderia phenoliruptrix]|uniref:3-oxoacyl-[acyl-carrier-protein] synthase 3 protein 1 n=1 Tax=Paraburkholderia phenoliruptrix TaxID=252970 RepID=A0A6J5KDH3_9BURK|nr:ketoacyl-ACP synthase III [Paraburkholderia phenoliruptrix]CAB4051045.1 3-oxoacyl-[acyl-carrier-protein] synthase 3 protein 1 [Paraburkholderia phenoliruptrix]